MTLYGWGIVAELAMLLALAAAVVLTGRNRH